MTYRFSVIKPSHCVFTICTLTSIMHDLKENSGDSSGTTQKSEATKFNEVKPESMS